MSDEKIAPDPVATPDPTRWWALAAIALGVSLIIMDATVVNVALPVVIRDLSLSATQAEWMNAVYSLMFAALLLVSGRAGDIWGRRRLLLIGLVVFVAASLFAGAADSAVTIIGARLLQGIGASLMLPSTLSTLNAMFQGRERAIAFAVWGSTIGGMAAVGPLVGGWLTTDHSWRWAFWMNIPIGIVVLALTLWAVPQTRDETGGRSLDVVGALLSATGLGLIVYALIEGERFGWWLQASGSLSPVPVLLAVGVATVVVFVLYQRRRVNAGLHVLVDLHLFGVRSFRYGAIAALVVALGEFGLLFTLPLLLQNALGYSALGTGWLIVALAGGTFLVSGAMPQLTQRIGPRAVVRTGLALEAVAVAGLALTISSHVATLGVAGWLFLYGLGVGMATAQLTSVILIDIPVHQSGQASGLQSTVRQLGSSLGVALLGTLLIVSLGSFTSSRLDQAGVPADQADSISLSVRGSLGGVIPSLEASDKTRVAGEAASAALIDATRVTTGVASIIILGGLAATLALPRDARPRRRDEVESESGATST